MFQRKIDKAIKALLCCAAAACSILGLATPASAQTICASAGRTSSVVQTSPLMAPTPSCFAPSRPNQSCLKKTKVCNQDLEVARIAWKYFENNYQPATGLTNAADNYTSTTMWDAASSLAATIAARQLDILTNKDFDDRIITLLGTLMTLKLYNGEAPNKAYNSATAAMTDYGNNATTGIGYSALDLARLASWLNILGCLHPKHANAAASVVQRWDFSRIIRDGQMYGVTANPTAKTESVGQEGRLGYEQYGGKAFAILGFDQSVASTYRNANATTTTILGVPIAYDTRDPRKFGAYNYVVTESYALDAMEFGLDTENTALVRNIYEVQKRRWQTTKIVTAVSEDNIDRAPHFLYNTIFAAGSAWNTITDTGADHNALKTLSTKAAFSLVTLFPKDPYSSVLLDAISSAYDPKRGWYSGIYESGLGYNKIMTANTNGIILQAILYKAFGPLNAVCSRCGAGIHVTLPKEASTTKTQCAEAGRQPPAPNNQNKAPNKVTVQPSTPRPDVKVVVDGANAPSVQPKKG